MSSQFWHIEHVSRDNLQSISQLLDNSPHCIASSVYVEALLELIHDGTRCYREPAKLTLLAQTSEQETLTENQIALGHKNLTEKYYAHRVLRLIHHRILTKRWLEFLDLPPEEQCIEKGALLIAQWCQPDILISEENVALLLDQIKNSTKQRLSSPTEEPGGSGDSMKNKVSNRPSPRDILEALNHVLFVQLQIHGNTSDYYDPENSYFDKVLKRRTGIPITLCILYMAVAQRLGVPMEAINFPNHFIIRFQPQENVPVYTYVDVFRGGKFMSETECLKMPNLPGPLTYSEELFRPIPPVKVYERMIQNLINVFRQLDDQRGENIEQLVCVLELCLAISPGEPDYTLLLVRLYVHFRINLREIDDMIDRAIVRDPSRAGMFTYFRQMADAEKEAVRTEPQPQKVVKSRSASANKNVQYGIGMIMRHRKYHYNCVIHGWDGHCEASQHWIMQMGVNNLPHGPNQPFYNVLVEDGSQRYAAQENLQINENPSVIRHQEVGRYFEEYCGKHYKANAEKAAEYPDDWEYIQHDAYVMRSVRVGGMRVMRLDGGLAPPKS